MLRVGLTGGIGSGKSTVARLLSERGALVIDADSLAREVVQPGTAGHAAVLASFGPEVLDADGSLDRSALAERVFDDEGARRRLEAIIHPRVRSRADELVASADADAVVVHDIPLLVEAADLTRFDVVVVVDLPEQDAVRRLLGRGMDPAEASRRISAQASREQRRTAADVVIDNTGSRAELAEQVDALWTDLTHRAVGLSRR